MSTYITYVLTCKPYTNAEHHPNKVTLRSFLTMLRPFSFLKFFVEKFMRVTPPILVRSMQGVFRRYAVRKGSVRSTQKSCYIVRRHQWGWNPPFWYAVFRGCLGGTQYAKGRYAVRKNPVKRTQTSIFTFKRSNFHQETQETWHTKSNISIFSRAHFARAVWGHLSNYKHKH